MRSLVFAAVFAYLFAIPMGMGEQGVWWGIVAGEVAGGLLGFVWARLYLSKLEARGVCEVRKSEAGA
jgi:Na+-driven multidrug efflux pump